jgi:succinate dehydrogenase/fumarate reductase flavoprotein subunit
MVMERFQEKVRFYKLNTVIVGTGAAGFNAADELWSMGQQEIAIVTDHINAGTSRNTGSDKQTYYKLTLAGEDQDSIMEMTQTLFSGQCVDGDLALCEAALSPQCFFKLVHLGVPFPHNRWGEYIGYKTDHDPRSRATSVGPYTSKYMTECLERSVLEKGIPIFDKTQVISILSDGEKAYGLLCLDLDHAAEEEDRFILFACENIIYATGGPAGMYADSVYPHGHYGASGIAFEAGVQGKNLTEWQYGMASVRPRWNVSGTYMQVLPRFYSTDEQGGDERDFLSDFFTDPYEMMSKVFLKGYQWPFDVRKVQGGSSIIDILVYMERSKGRRIYLDYRKNPVDSIAFEKLDQEAYEYLARAEACFGTPIERLKHMNGPAVDFYKEKGVDLEKEPLEIALCAQHNNGGLAIDSWWHTNLEGFFAVGEVSASHGVYRPGGSALNAGQAGSARAAKYIAVRRQGQPEVGDDFVELAEKALGKAKKLVGEVLGSAGIDGTSKSNRIPVQKFWDQAALRMSHFGAAIRNIDQIAIAIQEIQNEIQSFEHLVQAKTAGELWKVFRLKDILLSQYVYLSAMKDYIQEGGKSRGSALYTDSTGQKPDDRLTEEFSFCLDDGSRGDMVQEAVYGETGVKFNWRKIRPIPTEDDFFENVWRGYRQNKNVF